MADSPTSTFSFETLAPLALEAAFDGGHLTSDGGLTWLARADAETGVCAEIAAHLPNGRREARAHPLDALICQRVYQIACGYEDQNDATTLRHDPLLKVVCGRLTFLRLENAVTARDCYRIAMALGMVYLREWGRRASRCASCSTSIRPTTRRMETRRGRAILATTGSTCTTPC